MQGEVRKRALTDRLVGGTLKRLKTTLNIEVKMGKRNTNVLQTLLWTWNVAQLSGIHAKLTDGV